MIAEVRGLTNVNYKKRTLEMDIIKRALVIVVMFILHNFFCIGFNNYI